MKKILSVLTVCAVLLLSFCSCGDSEKQTEFDNEAATAAYREFVEDLSFDIFEGSESNALYNIVDIDGDGAVELLVYNDAKLGAYTYKADEEKTVQQLGEEIDYRIYNNTYRVEDTEKYPGLFVRVYEYDYVATDYDGTNSYSYITVKDGELAEEKLWDEDVTGMGKEKQIVTTYHQDKEFVEDAKKAYVEENVLRWYTPGFMSSARSYIPADYSKDEEYNYKIMLYNHAIGREICPDAYALYDANDDGEMDLLTYSDDTFAIYSLNGDAVKRMYVSTCDKEIGSVSLLKNGDVLTEYDNGIHNYIYDDLGDEFETVSVTSFGYFDINGEKEYTFAAQTVTKEEWEKQTEKYLKAKKVNIKWLPEAYDEYEKYTNDNSIANRDIGPFQNDTKELIFIDNKLYQSYVNYDNVRYILVSYDEYKVTQGWQWVPIGTKDDYSLDSIGEMKK